MKRRNFIKALGATTAVATLGSKRAQADVKKYKWKMVTSWPKNFPGLGVGAENLAKMINDLSGGRIKIKVFDRVKKNDRQKMPEKYACKSAQEPS